MKNHFLPICILAALHLSLSGCSQPNVAKNITTEKNKTNIQKVASSIVLYASFKQNRGPESAQQLIDFVENDKYIERNLSWMGIERDNFAQYMTSSVDQQKFKVRWGITFNPDGAAVPLVFEQTGDDDGVRRVALSNADILEVDSDAKYKELLAGKISKEDAGGAAWQGGDGTPDEE